MLAGSQAEYGAPEAPVSGRNEWQRARARAVLPSWVEPREQPSRPKGREGFAFGAVKGVTHMTSDGTETMMGNAGPMSVVTCLFTSREERSDV